MVSVLYTYQMTATDPQNKPLKFRLPQGPAGMTINTNTGLVQWTPLNTGSFFVQVAADGVGGSFYQGYTLTVVPFSDLPPQFTSTPATTAAPNAAYNYLAVAVSPVNYSITYSLALHPNGMSINAQSGAITWTPAASQLGGNPVAVVASDGHGATATQSFNVVVLNSGTNGPVVQPIPDQTVTAPSTFTVIPLDSYVSDPNYARNQITWTAMGTNLLSVTIDSNRVATISYPSGVNVAEQITFLATDPAGNSAYSTPMFTVIGNATPPVAAIANLSSTTTTSITNGTFQLLGTADEPGAPASVSIAWRIGLYDNSGAQVADVTPGPFDAAGYHEGRVPAGGSFGTLDFTLVRNGDYTLMLEVTDGTDGRQRYGAGCVECQCQHRPDGIQPAGCGAAGSGRRSPSLAQLQFLEHNCCRLRLRLDLLRGRHWPECGRPAGGYPGSLYRRRVQPPGRGQLGCDAHHAGYRPACHLHFRPVARVVLCSGVLEPAAGSQCHPGANLLLDSAHVVLAAADLASRRRRQ